MSRRLKLALCGVLLSAFASTVKAEECLDIASGSKIQGVIAALTPGIKKVFEHANICVNYVKFPVKRIQQEMVRGSIDGEFVRGQDYFQQMKDHVVRVPTPVLEGKGLLITLAAKGFKPIDIKSVGEKTIGVVHGVIWHEVLKKHFKKTQKTKTFFSNAKLLKAGRVDGILIDTVTLKKVIAAGVFTKEEVHQSNTLVDLSGYILLHKKNVSLIGKLDKSVQAIRDSGAFRF